MNKIYLRFETCDTAYFKKFKKEVSNKFNHLAIDKFSQENLIKNKKSCLILLIGETTYLNATIDKNIRLALKDRVGIIGIRIPQTENSNNLYPNGDFIVPARLQDNIKNEYVKIYDWWEAIDNLENIVQDSLARSLKKIPNDKRPYFGSVKEGYKNFKGKSIFLSHKSNDIPHVKLLFTYIKQLGISIYVDIYDEKLQNKSNLGLNKEVVGLIDSQIESCSEIFCFLTDKTVDSWWVPYEIGIAKAHKKKITSILTKEKGIPIPEYLRIEDKISTKNELKEKLKRFRGEIKDKDFLKEIMKSNDFLLDQFLR